MDKLQVLIDTFSEDDRKEFRIFINRQKSKKQRKDLELFELISVQTSPKEIQLKLYETPNKVAYHTLRKRLLRHLTDFIVLKEIDDDPTANSSISGFISLANYLFKHQSDELGWRFLLKAEQTAIENEQHELLNVIYQHQMDVSDTEHAIDINEIHKKWQENKLVVNENERISIAYNFIKKEINEVIFTGKDQDLNKIIDNLLIKYDIEDTVFERPQILYKVLELTRKVMFSRKDFFNFEPYLIKMYQELVSKHGFSKKNHFYKIRILYMISHILYRNRRFKKSNQYLQDMHDSMKDYNQVYYKKFYPKYVMLLAANYSYLNQNKKSVELLENVVDTELKKLPIEDQLNVKMNLSIFLGNQEEFKKSNHLLQTLNHSDNWLSKKMGVEWVLKKNMIEIMIQYELENFEIALNRIRAFERGFSDIFKHPLYARAKIFIQQVKSIINNPNILKKQAFADQVVNTLVTTPSEQEDLQAMAYYAWLKAKLLNKNYYQTLLEIANTNNEQ